MKGHGLPTAAVVAIFLFFFLPWVSVSCGTNQVATFSGYELAAGKELNMGFSTERIEGDSAMFIVPLAAIVAGAALWMGSGGSASAGAVKKSLIGSAIAGLFILAAKWFAMQENAQGGITVSGEIGLWGTIGALLLLLYGGITLEAEEAAETQYAGGGSHRRQASTSRSDSTLTASTCSHEGESLAFCSRCGAGLTGRGYPVTECNHGDERGDYCRYCGKHLTATA